MRLRSLVGLEAGKRLRTVPGPSRHILSASPSSLASQKEAVSSQEALTWDHSQSHEWLAPHPLAQPEANYPSNVACPVFPTLSGPLGTANHPVCCS